MHERERGLGRGAKYRDDEQLPPSDAHGDVAIVQRQRQDLAFKEPRCEVAALEPVHDEGGQGHRLLLGDRSGEADRVAIAVYERRRNLAVLHGTPQHPRELHHLHLMSIPREDTCGAPLNLLQVRRETPTRTRVAICGTRRKQEVTDSPPRFKSATLAPAMGSRKRPLRAESRARTGPPPSVRELLEQATRAGYTREVVDALRQGADANDCDALTTLAMFHRDGLRSRRGQLLIKRNARLAVEYDMRAAKLGDTSGMASVADALTSPPSTPSDLARGEKLYKRAFRLGNTTAALNLAATYQNLGRYRDAEQWFRRALAAGDPSALLELAKAELSGMGTRRNVPSAFERLRRLASGVAFTAPFERMEAMLIMADAFRNGWLVRRDYPQALRLLRKAVSLGSDAARGLLADEGFDVS